MSLNRNIPLLQMAAASREAMFIIPVLVVFYAAKGVTLSQFFLMQVIFQVVVLAIQMPAAYWSDRHSRHHQIMLGGALWMASQFLLCFYSGFGAVLGAEVMMGVGLALFTNNGEAMLFESLDALGRKAEHYKQLSKQRSWQSYAAALCMGTGGWLFTVGFNLPIALTAATAGLAFGCTLLLAEPPRHRRQASNPWRDSLKVNAYILHGHPELKWLMLYPALLSSLTLVMFWGLQPWLTGLGVKPTWMGLLLAGHFLFRGFSARVAPWIVHRVTVAGAFALSFATLAAGFLGMGLLATPWAFPLAMLGCGFSYCFTDALVRELLHRRLSSDIRASTLNAYNLLGKLSSIPLLIVAGRWAQAIGTSHTMLLMLLVALPLAWPLLKLVTLPTLEKRL
jgi:MFS family permease